MTIEQFAEIIDYLIKVVLPPNVSDDPPISTEQVLEVLEDQCDALRGKLIKHNITGSQHGLGDLG